MAASRKPRRASGRLAVGLSGGVDSVVLLHMLKDRPRVSAIHIHHGLSPNADAWADFCRRYCRSIDVPLTVRRVKVHKAGRGLEAAAREARYGAFTRLGALRIALAHNLDDQAETVLMNLLRGAGVRGASAMRARARVGQLELVRPLLGMWRDEILAYARAHELEWIEDESNDDESLTRNFIRRRLGPLIAERFPRWRESLARAARHFAQRDAKASELLRAYLGSRGLRAPSEAKLVEMLRQLTSSGARTRIGHDGAELSVYRGKVSVGPRKKPVSFRSVKWRGERRLALAALGGELKFRRAKGKGIDPRHLPLTVRLRSGGERLQPDPKRPRRTLKNLFQEAGVPPRERERLPLLYKGDVLVWVPGLGVDVRFRPARGKPGEVPEWRGAA